MLEPEKRRQYRIGALKRELAAVVGPGAVMDDAERRQRHAFDASWMSKQSEYIGSELPAPDIVVKPTSIPQIEEIVRLAYSWHVPVVPRGGGSGSQGGTFAPYGGIGLDLTGIDRIIEINTEDLTVTAQAGIDGAVLEKALNDKGYTLQHLPGSLNLGATLGGYLAARGSGVTSTKYGKAEDRVLAISAVVPPGHSIRTLGVPSHAAGPDLLGLMVGSEGTLGVITEATMQIEPLPEERRFLSFTFANVPAGLEAGRRIMTARLKPAAMRLYDGEDTAKLARVLDMPLKGCLLVVMCEGYRADLVSIEADAIAEICSLAGGTALGAEPAQRWWERKYQPFDPEHYPKLPMIFGTTDVAARFSDMPKIYEARKSLYETEFGDYEILYTAHFSHWYPWGTMIYDRFHVLNPPADPEEALELHDRLWNRAIAVALEHGGVLNDHHGIGLKLGRFMPVQYGATWRLLTAIKDAIDPLNLMNPGKLGFGAPKVGW